MALSKVGGSQPNELPVVTLGEVRDTTLCHKIQGVFGRFLSAKLSKIEEKDKIFKKFLARYFFLPYICTRKTEVGDAKVLKNAEIAQLVEHNLAKVGVASSSLVFRSTHEG